MCIFAVSDLHTDFAENRRRLQRISSVFYLRDVLVAGGDFADDLRIIDWTLRKLRSQFCAVFYIPGNHELWVSGGEYDSVRKNPASSTLLRRDRNSHAARQSGDGLGCAALLVV